MAVAKKKPVLKYKMPKTIGGALDLLYKVRTERSKLQAAAENLKVQESMIEDTIFKLFGKSKLEGARGSLAQASIKRSDVPTLTDWGKFEKYLIKSGELDLMQRRLSVEACRERWAAKKVIPGVTVFTKVSLSLTKRK